MGEKRVDFCFGHFRGVPDIVKEYKTLDSTAIALFGSATVMTSTQTLSEPIQKSWFGIANQ
jgi:hypothetical protein